jgi:hypothetical protein
MTQFAVSAALTPNMLVGWLLFHQVVILSPKPPCIISGPLAPNHNGAQLFPLQEKATRELLEMTRKCTLLIEPFACFVSPQNNAGWNQVQKHGLCLKLRRACCALSIF